MADVWIAATFIGAFNADTTTSTFGFPHVLPDFEGAKVFNLKTAFACALGKFGSLQFAFNVVFLIDGNLALH